MKTLYFVRFIGFYLLCEYFFVLENVKKKKKVNGGGRG